MGIGLGNYVGEAEAPVCWAPREMRMVQGEGCEELVLGGR